MLRMAVKLSMGRGLLLLHSTLSLPVPAIFIVQRCRSLKALKVNIALKSLLSAAPDPIWQLTFPGVAAFQEIGLCV